jgi:hypothetical protein
VPHSYPLRTRNSLFGGHFSETIDATMGLSRNLLPHLDVVPGSH